MRYARSNQIFKDQYILSLKPLESNSLPLHNSLQHKGFIIYLYSLDYQLLQTFFSATKAAEYFDSTRHTIIKYAKSGNIFKNKYILSLKEILPQ